MGLQRSAIPQELSRCRCPLSSGLGCPPHILGSPRPAECGPCGRLSLGSLLSDESDRRRDSPRSAQEPVPGH